MAFDEDGNLSLDEDPKILAAKKMEIFPLEINKANYHDLIRVPGIGTKSAREIINIRRKKPFNNLDDLKRLGVVTKRAEPYIKLEGEYQNSLDNYL